MDYCQNCGHEAHCNEKCLQDYGESEKTVCCTTCRCESDEENDKFLEDLANNTPNSSQFDEDSFNGA